jgi:hypothetical protein
MYLSSSSPGGDRSLVIVFVPSKDQEECPLITTLRGSCDKSCGTLELILSCTQRSGDNAAEL